MSVRIQYEGWLMVLSLITGAWLMLAYDTLRVFRLIYQTRLFLDRAGGFSVLALCRFCDIYPSV